MSLERVTACVKLSWSKTAWSLITVPAISMRPLPQSTISPGATTLSCRPAAAVTILKIEPGSKASETARLRQRELGEAL